MKPASDVTAVICDYGSFQSLAETMALSCKKVYYHSPCEEEFEDLEDFCIGDGMDDVTRLDDVMDDTDIFKSIDLFIFPDIGYTGLQRYLRGIGKKVWGSMGADRLETSRTDFLDTLKKLKLPIVPYVVCTGLAALAEHLKTVKNKWVKVNRWRKQKETWKHIDMEHTIPILCQMAVDFGGWADKAVFVVQDTIESDAEIGYDGWCVNGQFPKSSFQGYEFKNELYLGSLLDYKKLPEPVRFINESIAPTLKEFGYQNFMATEIRMKKGTPYFIDPTLRMPGQTGEQMLETCLNLADVIWHGANGELIEPEFGAKFAVEATMHYTTETKAWKALRIPESVKQWCKLYHYCVDKDGMYQFPPHKSDEVGVIMGLGDTIEEAIDHLKDNFKLLKNEPLSIEVAGFAELLKSVHEAEKQGLEFTEQKVPEPTSVLSV